MALGEDDDGISRQPGESAPFEFAPLPDAWSDFDVSAFRTPRDVRGRHFEFDKAAAEQSREILRRFLQSVGRRDSGLH